MIQTLNYMFRPRELINSVEKVGDRKRKRGGRRDKERRKRHETERASQRKGVRERKREQCNNLPSIFAGEQPKDRL